MPLWAHKNKQTHTIQCSSLMADGQFAAVPAITWLRNHPLYDALRQQCGCAQGTVLCVLPQSQAQARRVLEGNDSSKCRCLIGAGVHPVNQSAR
jgi:hypothetical protein